MVVDDMGSGSWRMEDMDGTGEGEWGKQIWVMGTPLDGGG
jgi:hypothetical protein